MRARLRVTTFRLFILSIATGYGLQFRNDIKDYINVYWPCIEIWHEILLTDVIWLSFFFSEPCFLRLFSAFFLSSFAVLLLLGLEILCKFRLGML